MYVVLALSDAFVMPILAEFSQLLNAERFPRIVELFLQSAIKKSYQAGETIVFQNQQLDHLGLLQHGEAEIEIISFEGDMLIAEKFFAGTVLSAAAFLDGKTSPAAVVAATQCTVLFVPYSKLRQDPALNSEAVLLAGLCAAGLYRMAEQLMSSSLLLPLKERVMQRLTRLNREDGEVIITAEKLATYLAVSKHRVHRILNDLEKEQRIENSYGAVRLLGRD
ncbi:Crp/Fnr family transcriptional regulator [Vibrio ulleungensis]|uniref:Crp/Fnr family transcriptional regulator n=1 Tax=Vibrio ulleungensis TaxID=2807619 RepID=A0ABS2HLS4_9VIBR|nr:Crp/Fnr family transcriptional regulator [Vibrio ulleungensis]MBM7037163.1 Crp/Fnr family transcriptional regulator [Vibrio ulleungensis]